MRITIDTNDRKFRAAILEEARGAVKSLARSDWEEALQAAAEDLSRKFLRNDGLRERLEKAVVDRVMRDLSVQKIVDQTLKDLHTPLLDKLCIEAEKQFPKLITQVAAYAMLRVGETAQKVTVEAMVVK